jgi:hypothetical protein
MGITRIPDQLVIINKIGIVTIFSNALPLRMGVESPLVSRYDTVSNLARSRDTGAVARSPSNLDHSFWPLVISSITAFLAALIESLQSIDPIQDIN